MNKPEIKGWEITYNEKGVQMATLPAEQLRNLFFYVDQLEQNCIKHDVMQVLPIEFLEWYSGTTKERLLEMYEAWKKREGNTSVASEGQEEANTCADGTLHEWKVSPDNLNDVYCKKCYKSA